MSDSIDNELGAHPVAGGLALRVWRPEATRVRVYEAGSVDTLGGMCRRVTCKQCGKPNWAGCGAHVEAVLSDVPKADRCRCRETGGPKATSKAVTAAPPATAAGRFKAWLRQ